MVKLVNQQDPNSETSPIKVRLQAVRERQISANHDVEIFKFQPPYFNTIISVTF